MKNFLTIFSLTLLLLPTFIFAYQGYQPLVGIPGVDPNTDFDKYINTLYALSISIAALLAVIKIIIAGVKWMLTDIVPAKGEAKKDIQGALIGLLIILAAVLILTVINPKILKVDLQLDPVALQKMKATTPSTPSFNGNKIEAYDKVMDFSEAGIVTGPNPQPEALKNLCENIVPEACPNGWWSESLGYPESACYKGIFDSETKTCLVKANEMKLSSFKCEGTSKLDIEVGSTVTSYDCTTAKAACISAGGKAGGISPGDQSVNCSYN